MNEIEIVVTSQDKSDLDKVAAKAKRAGQEIGDGIQKGFKDGEKASEKASTSIKSDLDKVEKSGRDAFSGLRDVAQEAFSGLGDMVGGESGDIIGKLAGGLKGGTGALLGVGGALGGAVLAGLSAEWKEDAVGGLLAAQTGAASSAAEGLGNTAGDVFSDNFGESVEQVGEAMKAVFENKLIDTDAAQGDVEKVTEKVMTLSQVTGEEFGRISSAASRMVKTGIAGSVDEALDLIGRAQEKGLNAQQDLLDTMEEYSTKFHDLGLNGAESLGLINQAMEGGARNTDLAADALKEFAIRAQDMSVGTQRGFQTIGLDADVMGQRIAQGGSAAKGALRDTLTALEAMPPGIARNTAAVDLFGTKAEDLGQALYDMDLDSAAKEFGDFGGTVEEQMKKISESTSFWDKLGRGISDVTSGLGEWLDKSMELELPDGFKDTIEEIQKAQRVFDATGSTKGLDELKEKYPDAAAAIDRYIDKKRDEKAATDDTSSSASEYLMTLDKLISKQQEAATGVLDLSEANIGYQEAMDNANKTIQENGQNTDLSSEKGRENQGVLNDLADKTWNLIGAMEQQAATTDEVRGFMGSARDQFIDTAMSMGYSRDQALDLANKLRLVPGNYTANVSANTATARAELAGFQGLLNRIFGRTYTIAANVFASTAAALGGGHASGGVVGAEMSWGAATGGQRHSSTVINEAGPEMVELPNGSRVATAGATRAMGEAGWLGGGGGPTEIAFSWAGSSDPLIRALMQGIRAEVLNRHGGSVSQALGKSGVA